MSVVRVGVDVGNSDTKSQNTSIISGYQVYSTRPTIAKKILEYKGLFYVPSVEFRFPPKIDKTEDDHCLILALFSIGEEILYTLKNKNVSTDKIQEEISKITSIKLGVGLPPGHMNNNGAENLSKYYKNALSDTIKFNYCGYDFSFVLDNIKVFPQDFVACYYQDNKLTIPKLYKESKYIIVGIGGGTADIIPIVENLPDVNACVSLEMGSRILFEEIIGVIQRDTRKMLKESEVERILRGKPTLIGDEIKALIKSATTSYTKKLLDRCTQLGIDFESTPIIYYGGGCLLLKETLTELMREIHPNVKPEDEHNYWEFLEDINANAKGYASNL